MPGRLRLGTVVVLMATAALVACDGDSGDDGAAAAAPAASAAAREWTDGVRCPASVAELEAVAGVPGSDRSANRGIDPSPEPVPSSPSPSRPGTETTITPPGEVVAVVRCDVGSAGAGAESPVARTVLLDPQPLSWFSDGDHWPRTVSPPFSTPEASLVTLHYASGPDVVVTQWTEPIAGDVTPTTRTHRSNGVLRCAVPGPDDDPVPDPVTCVARGGEAFTPPSRPVAAGAPPVECLASDTIRAAGETPTAEASPRPGTELTPAPHEGVVVVVLCSDRGNRTELWGEVAQRFAPVPGSDQAGSDTSFDAPAAWQIYLGYSSGPPVNQARIISTHNPPDGSWLDGAVGLRGGVSNGVIACRYSDPAVRPGSIAGCVPVADAVAGVVPSATASVGRSS